MATHSNTLVWQIPWTERNLAGYGWQGLKRVTHSLTTTTTSNNQRQSIRPSTLKPLNFLKRQLIMDFHLNYQEYIMLITIISVYSSQFIWYNRISYFSVSNGALYITRHSVNSAKHLFPFFLLIYTTFLSNLSTVFVFQPLFCG